MKALFNLFVSVLVVAFAVWFWRWSAGPEMIFQENSGVPLSVFNLTFRVGSADDPPGKSGIANLTARLVREGGVRDWERLPARTRAEIEDYLFPLAGEIDVSVEKEQVSFQGLAPAAEAPKIFEVAVQMLLAPAFAEAEFDRLKAETLDQLEKQMPREDQEELGKMALDQAIYGKAHPYGHAIEGTVKDVHSISLDDIRRFYASRFGRKRLTVGLAGVISPELRARAKAFQVLPGGDGEAREVPEAPKTTGLSLTIVKGPFEATGVHLGHALGITRAHDDFSALYLASTAFGKHRSFVGRLMKNVREVRGLNYGTFSYVEDFPNGGRRLTEPTQAARSRQAFTVWGRPTPPANGCFLLRQLLREVDSLGEKGLTQEEFELGRSHLIGNVPLLGTGLERQLGYAIDSRFYEIAGNYLTRLQGEIKGQTNKNVLANLKRHLRPKDLRIVVVTADPEKFKKAIASPRCDVQYAPGVQKPAEVLAEDMQIASYPVAVKPEHIAVITAESIYSE